ncbi:uncharacterized protein [Typha latifolia]|uniref:uncharacterized protein n=1 Tax=Typha latifolia TaxID=4733 RepID=UPI003C2E66A4
MRKLYNGKGRRIHPTPPAPVSAQAMLPAAVMALAAALTAEEQEVLSYLLSCGGGGYRGRRRHAAHVPELGCACFTCYKSFWARWDASPNRHVIHQIIDAVEEGIQEKERRHEVRGGRRRRRRRSRSSAAGAEAEAEAEAEEERKVLSMMDGGHVADDDDDGGDDDDYDDDDDDDDDCCMDEDGDKSTVRKLVSFIGERVWGVWK